MQKYPPFLYYGPFVYYKIYIEYIENSINY